MYLDTNNLVSWLHVVGHDGFGELAQCIWIWWIWWASSMH